MTFLPRPRKDAEEHQFVYDPQGLFDPLGHKGGEIAAGLAATDWAVHVIARSEATKQCSPFGVRWITSLRSQ